MHEKPTMTQEEAKRGEKKCYLSVHLFGYAADIF